MKVVGKSGSDDDGNARQLWCDHRFLRLMNIGLKKGRNFYDQPSANRSSEYILNETALGAFKLADPINKKIAVDGDTGMVVGVVKDFNFASLHGLVEPLVIKYERDAGNYLLLKVSPGSMPETLSFMEQQVKALSPGSNFSYSFLDERLARLYEPENRMSQLFTFFAVLALFISCLGLFGLSMYTTRLRIKEAGIRKILGATAGAVTLLFSKEFLKLVLTGTVIALPAGWWFVQQWLSGFAYRAPVEAWVFVVSAASVLLVAAITVGFQSFRAASVKPADTLGAE